jgi:hypothetical protein
MIIFTISLIDGNRISIDNFIANHRSLITYNAAAILKIQPQSIADSIAFCPSLLSDILIGYTDNTINYMVMNLLILC